MTKENATKTNGYVVAIKEEIESFLKVTAVKSLQFAQHSAHWTESIFWVVLLVGATALAILDVRKAYQQFADEETYTSMNVVGLQRTTFDDMIVCVDYDPRALNLSNPLLIQHAERSGITEVAKLANTSAVVFLNRLQKLVMAISLIEHGRTTDYEKKLHELQRDDDLQQLQDLMIKQGIDVSDASREVGNWLCNSFRLRIDTVKRGALLSAVNPCIPQKISWLGVIPFTNIATSETAVCVNVSGLISFESMLDRVVISVYTDSLLSVTNENGGYQPGTYVDFSGDPVSTDLTNDYITFPSSGCRPLQFGVDAKVHLINRWNAPCNVTAKTRFTCYADCDMQLYAGTMFSNCTLLAWRYLYASNRTMCFDIATIEEFVDSRRQSSRTGQVRTDLWTPCWTSCLFPCEYRQYEINEVSTDTCYTDYLNAPVDGVSVELHSRRFRMPVFEEHFTVSVSDLFSRIGGTCGLWLGVGLLGICHALLFPLKLLLTLLLQRRSSKGAIVPEAAVELAERG